MEKTLHAICRSFFLLKLHFYEMCVREGYNKKEEEEQEMRDDIHITKDLKSTTVVLLKNDTSHRWAEKVDDTHNLQSCVL